MIVFGIVGLAFAGNAICGLAYGKMWNRNRWIYRDYPGFGWGIVVQLSLAGLIAALFWTGVIKP